MEIGIKGQFKLIDECHYNASLKGVSVDLFLSEKLFEEMDAGAFSQILNAVSFPGVKRVAITPDVHQGYVVPIGTVIETDGVLLPTAAGYDISCGMMQLSTNLTWSDVENPEKRRSWVEAVQKRVGMGLGIGGVKNLTESRALEVMYNGGLAFSGKYHEKLERSCLPVDESVVGRPFDKAMSKYKQLGSLGGGNHFIELQVDQSDRVWIMLHTGSRGFGWQIADHFFKVGAKDLKLEKGQRDNVWFDRDSELGNKYWNYHNAAANFAIGNRITIAQEIMEVTSSVLHGDTEIYYEISHNLIQQEGENDYFVHRKGSTRAFPGDKMKGTMWEKTGHPILIPGSMETGSAILFAKDSMKSIYTVNHGSGRKLSRGQARRTLNQTEVNKRMKDLGILSNHRKIPIDESGPCYKDLDEVLQTVVRARLADVTIRLRPIANLKGND